MSTRGASSSGTSTRAIGFVVSPVAVGDAAADPERVALLSAASFGEVLAFSSVSVEGTEFDEHGRCARRGGPTAPDRLEVIADAEMW